MVEQHLQPTTPPILVVEDDAGLRTLFIALLTRDGFQVECANDGAQALERLARRAYSVVLLDLMMPVKNGYDVLRTFAESSPWLLRQTIVTTGVSERDLSRMDRSSVFAVLRKPFDIDCLMATVKDCARQNRGRGPGNGDGGDGKLHASARKFEASIPQLRRMLSGDGGDDHERMLRHEMRRVVGKLGGVLAAAASVERDSSRARRYQQLGRTASSMAGERTAPARGDQ